uniref:Uncharacterized protein n=1 Tax=Florenciella parvula TaxID=236787 RepID=A0A7S2CAG9_9STRA
MSYGATEGGGSDLEEQGDDVNLVNTGKGPSTGGHESMFVKMWNQIPAAFPFFSSILYVVQVYTIANCYFDIDDVVDDCRDAAVAHIDKVNEFQTYQMFCFHGVVITNFLMMVALFSTMGTGMQRFCNFLDDFEEYHNFQGLTHWTIYIIERTLELLVVLAYALMIGCIFFYLVWVGGYFMTSTFASTCDYDDATADLLSILSDDVSYVFDGVDDAVLCDKIVGINEDTATVMADCIIVACIQVIFMLFVVELHKKSQHIMHEHMYDDEELDVITGVIQAKTTTIEDEGEEEEEDDEPVKAPAVVEDAAPTPAPAPAEEDAPEGDQEEFVEEEEIM